MLGQLKGELRYSISNERLGRVLSLSQQMGEHTESILFELGRISLVDNSIENPYDSVGGIQGYYFRRASEYSQIGENFVSDREHCQLKLPD